MPSLSVGSNGGQLLLFLKEWCDSLAMECCSGVCLVTDKDGWRVYGLFHQMKEKEHNNFEAKLADLGLWAAQCIAGNLSLECCSGMCLVTDRDGQRVYGLFHQMREKEHNNFEAKLAHLGLWAAQCIAGNLSTGKYNVQSCSNVYSNHHSALLLQFPLI